LGGLAFGTIYEYLSTMVYYYVVQEFGKPNTAMTTSEDYPYSVFGIMIRVSGIMIRVRVEGGTYLPCWWYGLAIAIYIGVFVETTRLRC
jgi:hypothetical protein